MLAPFVEGDSVSLRPLRPDDVTQRYVGWLNDPRVVQHTMAGSIKHTAESTRAYVSANLADSAAMFWQVVHLDDHVGNMRLSNIDKTSGSCELAIIIGEETARGKGIGSRAIHLAAHYALSDLSLRNVRAMISEKNEQSIRAFQRVGFVEDARVSDYFDYCGESFDGIWMVMKATEQERSES